MGAPTYDVLCDKLLPNLPEDSQYSEITNILKDHFDPKPNEILENYRFHLRKQKESESCADFLVFLKRLSANCIFGSYLNTALRNQFVFGLINQKIKSRLLEKSDLTLEIAVNTANAFEIAERGGIELHQHMSRSSVNEIQETVNAFGDKRKDTKKIERTAGTGNKQPFTRKCYRCGSTSHLANHCTYKEAVCEFCKTKGHLRKVCLKEKRQVNLVAEEDDISSDNVLVDELFQIYEGGVNNIKNNKLSAPVTMVSLGDAERHFGDLDIHDNDTLLYSYCKTQLDCVGYIMVNVATATNNHKVKMYLVRAERKPLLGREWLRTIKLNWDRIIADQLHKPGMDVKAIQADKFNDMKLKDIVSKYTNLFLPFTGKIVGHQARLHIKENALPKFFKARRVPFPLTEAVEKEIKKQVDEGLLEKVDTTLRVDEHPLPTVEEMFSTMAGGQKFSKIDLSKAYLQLEIHPDDRHYLTINTPLGLFQPTRMMYGVTCAPAKWQRFIEMVLHGIKGVSVFLDDIRITADTDELHLERINEVLERLNNFNMRVNWEKSEFMKDQIEYCGYIIDKNGIRKGDAKVEAVQNMRRPTNKDEDLNCEQSFVEAKRQILSDTVLTHYDFALPVVLAVDASPYGVGAVLSHIYPDGLEKPIQFASQTLSSVQQRYSQIDKEAYAIIYGIRKFYQYLFGRKFILVTDNKPISQIFSPHKGLPTLSATRMQHYAIFLESFDFEIRLKRSKDNANADAVSRLPIQDTNHNVKEVNIIENECLENLPIHVSELRDETRKDDEVYILYESLKQGRECDGTHRWGIRQTEFALQQGVAVRDYLSNDKWKFGRITAKQGELHYEIKLDDNRVWKRHADQIRKIGDQIQIPAIDPNRNNTLEPKEIPPTTKENTPQLPDPSSPKQTESTPNEPSPSLPEPSPPCESIVPETPGNINNTPNEIQTRRSKRAIRPPERFKDFAM
ncbi:uncharacterized protein LOC129944986 [Eupeodes corollae]|uniref:uncharacterized protein LOC129944986 n=1 Tax=Eupeodes corollae TaxID=290404 RepID=UPI00249219B4|nr:uncharacterized protein LOC129944986 [Eupeodes corollae]